MMAIESIFSACRRLVLGLTCLALVGCGSDFADLDAFMAEVKARPKGLIDPIPTYPPYQAFTYKAMSKRSPFERQLEIREVASTSGASNVKPDPNRSKEFLESFAIESLKMVGTIYKSGVLWGLIGDSANNVHRVTIGNYMGRNHGKITSISESQINLIEIVPNGAGAWVERPRTVAM